MGNHPDHPRNLDLDNILEFLAHDHFDQPAGWTDLIRRRHLGELIGTDVYFCSMNSILFFLKGEYEMKTKFFNALSLAVIMAMLITSLALADSISADADSLVLETPHANSLSTTQNAGTTVIYPFSAVINNTGGTGNDVFPGSVAVSISRSGGWLGDGTPSTFTFSSYDTPQVGGIEVAVPCGSIGTMTMTVSLQAGTSTNGKSLNPNSVNLSYNITAGPDDPSCAPTDNTPPVITPMITGALGNNGWYVSDVIVSWNVSDPDSTITSTSGCDSATIDYDTSGVTLTCTATSAGGTSSQSVTIKRDATVPAVSLVGGPTDGGSYFFGFVPEAPTCDASDVTSGLVGACTVTGYSGVVGDHTVTASASDNAGNIGTDSANYDVLAWTLTGFYQPVDMNGVWNTVKGGSTVPFKFEVFAGSMELTDTAVVQSFVATPVACPVTGVISDAIEFTTSGGTSLRYDWTAGQFINNWQTPKKPGACYVVTMTTQDGSTLSANFKLK